MPSAPVTVVLSKVGRLKRSGDGWSARCPAHEDKQPSLSIAEGEDGRALLTCHAGCDLETICKALGMDVLALFVEEPTSGKVVIAEYRYTDAEGELLYVKERLYPKEFRYRRPDGKGGWEWKLGRVARPLYRLPEILAAKKAGKRVWFCEGERDVHTLEALGEVATTAGGVKDFRPEHAKQLEGCKVTVVADNDEEGRKLAQAVAAATQAPVLVSELGKDISDHVRAGGKLEELVPLTDRPVLTVVEGEGDLATLVDVARAGDDVVGETRVPELGWLTFQASSIRSTPTGRHARVDISTGIGTDSQRLAFDVCNTDRDSARRDLSSAAARVLGEPRWGPKAAAIKLRLDTFCDSYWSSYVAGSEGEWVNGSRDKRPVYLLEPYLLEGGGTILFGPPGAAKSYMAMIWALGVTHGNLPWPATQTPVLLVNLERDAGSVAWRTACIAEVIGTQARLLVINRRGYTLQHVHEAVLSTVKRHGVGLVIVDSLSRAGTGSLIDDQDSNRAMDMLNALGVAWCILAHTPRADTTHEYGSVMQSAAADRTVRCVSSTDRDRNRAGVQLEVVKANDRGRPKPETFTLEFDPNDDLSAFRRAHRDEWPELVSSTASQEDLVADYLAAEGKAATGQIAADLGMPPNQVRAICKRSARISALEMGGGRGRETTWVLSTPVALSEEG